MTPHPDARWWGRAWCPEATDEQAVNTRAALAALLRLPRDSHGWLDDVEKLTAGLIEHRLQAFVDDDEVRDAVLRFDRNWSAAEPEADPRDHEYHRMFEANWSIGRRCRFEMTQDPTGNRPRCRAFKSRSHELESAIRALLRGIGREVRKLDLLVVKVNELNPDPLRDPDYVNALLSDGFIDPLVSPHRSNPIHQVIVASRAGLDELEVEYNHDLHRAEWSGALGLADTYAERHQ